MPYRPKNSPNWHYDFQIRGRRFHGSTGSDDYESAKAIEAEARVKARSGQSKATEYTISEAIGTYLADVCEHQPSAQTSLSQARAVLKVIPGTTRLTSLTNAEILRFTRIRRAQVSNGTVNRQLQFLGRALRHMARFHGAALPDLELRAAQTPESEERVRELTGAEQVRLFEHLRPDLHHFVKFALMTGARRGTICRLKWTDIDLDAGQMMFRLKGGRKMMFPISPEMRAFLSALPCSNVLAHRAYVFTFIDAHAERRRITPNGGHIAELWRDALEAAEIEDFRFHDLRHTFATRVLRSAGNLKLVSRLLGHRKIESTMRYAHVMDEDLRQAMAGFSPLDNATTEQPRSVGTGR